MLNWQTLEVRVIEFNALIAIFTARLSQPTEPAALLILRLAVQCIWQALRVVLVLRRADVSVYTAFGAEVSYPAAHPVSTNA
jgi:hypothetical protein